MEKNIMAFNFSLFGRQKEDPVESDDLDEGDLDQDDDLDLEENDDELGDLDEEDEEDELKQDPLGDLTGQFSILQRQNQQLLDRIAEMEENQKELQGTFSEISSATYDAQIKNLKEQRKLARREQDFDLMDEIDTEIENQQAAKKDYISSQKKTNKKVENESINSHLKDEIESKLPTWLEKNEWYIKHPGIQAAWKQYATDYVQKNNNVKLSADEIFAHATKQVKKQFGKGSDVSSRKTERGQGNRGRGPGRKKKVNLKDFDEAQIQISKNMAEMLGVPLEDYLASIPKDGENPVTVLDKRKPLIRRKQNEKK